MNYFTIEELCHSATGKARGIDNTAPPEIRARLEKLVERVLDPVREMYGAPLIVNSGYRCAELNRAIGGAANSQHMRGEAADITTGKIGANKVLFDLIRTSDIPFDQLIDEKDYQWIHISCSDKPRRQVLHL